MRLVRPIAARLALQLPRRFELDDLISAGYLGLIAAADNFRPGEHGGAPFSAYARMRIRGFILDSVRRSAYVENTRCSLVDIAEPGAAVPMETRIDAARLAARVAAAVGTLPVRMRSAVTLHYDGELRLPAVGKALRVGKRQASKIHMTAIRRLRSRLVI
jgi:RNA polymerase sigma factor (sigma-70 family)